MKNKRHVSISTWILVLGADAGEAAAGEKARMLTIQNPNLEKPTEHNIQYFDENGQIQSGIRCSTPQPSDDEKAQVQAEVKEWLKSHPRRLQTTTVIPVAFHVVHDSDEGYVTTTQISDQMDVLNAAFASTAFSFNLVSTDYTDNYDWFIRCGSVGKERWMKQALAIDPAHTLNLYTCGPTQLFGWSYMPWTYPEDSFWHGPVVHFETLPGGDYEPYNLGNTMTHEIGHYLGLDHTFEGGCRHSEGVADTPPEKSAAYGCNYGRDTCAGDGPDPIHNFMDYSNDACIWEFTQGQDDRMQIMTAMHRPSLGT